MQELFLFILKLIFLLEFVIFIVLFWINIKRENGFYSGFIFGILYFIFIPGIILVVSGKLELSLVDFSNTYLNDVILANTKYEFLLLILYLFSIIFLISIENIIKSKIRKRKLKKINYKKTTIVFISDGYIYFLFLITIIVGLLIFFASGIYSGHWYINKQEFFQKYGQIGISLGYIHWSIKILFMSSLLHLVHIKGFYIRYILLGLFFILFDMFITGNRIFAFLFFAGVFVVLLKQRKFKILLFISFLILPIGYVFSLYRHIRGLIFIEGIPDFYTIKNLFLNTISHESLMMKEFLLSISESVNLNVLIEILNKVDINNFLWGKTFIKIFTFLIPRSIWENKPHSITVIVGNEFSSSEYLSLVTTIIGEVHYNFYLFGFFILPLILFLYKKFLNKFIYSFYLNFLIGILVFRLPFSDIFLASIFVIILIKLFTYTRIIFRNFFKGSRKFYYNKKRL